MPLPPDPHLPRLSRVDASTLQDDRAVYVPGAPDLDHIAEKMESVPRPHACASVINWLIVVGCAIALAVVSIPELRDAIVQVLR